MNRILASLAILSLVLAACLAGQTSAKTAQASTIAGARLTAQYPTTIATGGWPDAEQTFGDPVNDLVVNGWSLVAAHAQTFDATNYLTLKVYDCAPGGTTMGTPGTTTNCTEVARWDGQSQTVPASTVVGFTWINGASSPYTLVQGNTFHVWWLKNGSTMTPALSVLGN